MAPLEANSVAIVASPSATAIESTSGGGVSNASHRQMRQDMGQDFVLVDALFGDRG